MLGDPGVGAWVLGRDLYGRFEITERTASTGLMIAEGSMVNGRPAFVSAPLPEGYPVRPGTSVVVYDGGAQVPAGGYVEYTTGGVAHLFENESGGSISIGSTFVATDLTERRFRVSPCYFGDLARAVRVLTWPDMWNIAIDRHTRSQFRRCG